MPFPIARSEIRKTEEVLAVRFPSSFVGKMMRDNGGQIAVGGDTWQLHPFRNSGDRRLISRTTNDIVSETRSWRERAAARSDGVAIASNGGADALILLPRADQPDLLAEQVYWWDHETGELSLVAEDFADLLAEP